MWDFLSDPLVVFCGTVTIIAVTAILAEQWRRVREQEIEAWLSELAKGGEG